MGSIFLRCREYAPPPRQGLNGNQKLPCCARIETRSMFFDSLRPPASHEAGGLPVPFQFFFHRCSVRISTADSSGFARCAVMPAS